MTDDTEIKLYENYTNYLKFSNKFKGPAPVFKFFSDFVRFENYF